MTNSLAYTVRTLRRRQALTQEELAEKAGLSATTVANLETDSHEPSVRTLRKIADALNVTPQQLLDGQIA